MNGVMSAVSTIYSARSYDVLTGDGVRLAVRDQAGSQPTVVLLHGLASTCRWWDLVTAHLHGRRVVRWDHRGHGRSASPGTGYDIATLASDAAAVLDTMELTGCVVAGHSMGAVVALHLAASRPDLVAAVCCVDGGLLDPVQQFGTHWPAAQHSMCSDRRTAPTAAAVDAWARGHGLPAAARPAVLANFHPPGDPDGDPDGPLQLRLSAVHEHALARSLWRQQPAGLLRRITAPVLAVLARPDAPATLENRRHAVDVTVRRAGRPVRQLWLDGGHQLPLQHPRAVADAITAVADETGTPT